MYIINKTKLKKQAVSGFLGESATNGRVKKAMN